LHIQKEKSSSNSKRSGEVSTAQEKHRREVNNKLKPAHDERNKDTSLVLPMTFFTSCNSSEGLLFAYVDNSAYRIIRFVFRM
jgi:hypothetical protein